MQALSKSADLLLRRVVERQPEETDTDIEDGEREPLKGNAGRRRMHGISFDGNRERYRTFRTFVKPSRLLNILLASWPLYCEQTTSKRECEEWAQ